jgi:pimeloyl-ACP methyl ester carboxylesterase
LAQLLPDARHVELARAGHTPFLSHTAQLVPVLRDFLAAA